MPSRTFEYAPAVRKSAPLLLGIVGPSGSGKTKSALRWATGIQSVTGGDIAVIDSEADRSLHYVGQHRFHHIPFAAPFGPLDYLAALEFAVSKGAKTVIIDSGSHMHEGPGGMLELHDKELARLGGNQKMSFPAWSKPKSDLRRFVNSLQQIRVNLIMCFRAQEKTAMPKKDAKDRDLISLGMMPIAPKGLIYEFAACPILKAGAKGVPTWESTEIGESEVIKLPNYLAHVFADDRPLDENHGRQMAEWAGGGGPVAAKPQPAAAVGGARREQIDEIGRETERIGWTGAEAKAWLQSAYGVSSRNQLTEQQATSAIVDLMEKGQ